MKYILDFFIFGYVNTHGESDFTISVLNVEVREYFFMLSCDSPNVTFVEGLKETVFVFKSLSSLDRGTYEDPVIGLFVLFSAS